MKNSSKEECLEALNELSYPLDDLYLDEFKFEKECFYEREVKHHET